MKPRILVLCDYYSPGIKGGGGMWAVKNIVDRFADRYDFFVVTRNHDGRDDLTPFTTVKTGNWNRVGEANVFYLSPAQITARTIGDLVNEIAPQAVFLNSVFSTPVVKFLTARRRGLVKAIPVILASCGELTKATLKMKRAKKLAYLTAAKALGLYRGLIWRASFDDERKEIQAVFGRDVEILLAPDLTPKTILPNYDSSDKPAKRSGHAKFIFLSRIARKKNLLYFLRVLKKCTNGNVELEIVGSAEDPSYWDECSRAIAELGDNIAVSVSGPVSNDAALARLVDSHFFVLPTMNENFGYVCIEALASGCPIILSDQTVWSGLEERGIGRNISLTNDEAWEDAVMEAVSMEADDYKVMSAKARQFAVDWLADESIERATAELLGNAVSRSK